MEKPRPSELLEPPQIEWTNFNEKSMQRSRAQWEAHAQNEIVIKSFSVCTVLLNLGVAIKDTDFVLIELSSTLNNNYISLHRSMILKPTENIEITLENTVNRPYTIMVDDLICFVRYIEIKKY